MLVTKLVLDILWTTFSRITLATTTRNKLITKLTLILLLLRQMCRLLVERTVENFPIATKYYVKIYIWREYLIIFKLNTHRFREVSPRFVIRKRKIHWASEIITYQISISCFVGIRITYLYWNVKQMYDLK